MKPYNNPTLRFVRFTAWAAEHFPRFTVDYRTNVEARWAFRRAVRNNPALML
jgi:hypothetical protein